MRYRVSLDYIIIALWQPVAQKSCLGKKHRVGLLQQPPFGGRGLNLLALNLIFQVHWLGSLGNPLITIDR